MIKSILYINVTKKKPYLVCGGPGLTAASKAGPPGVATARSKAAEVQQAAIRDLAVGDVEVLEGGCGAAHHSQHGVRTELLQGEMGEAAARLQAGGDEGVAESAAQVGVTPVPGLQAVRTVIVVVGAAGGEVGLGPI